jgi:adenosylmethionine---8-amino-7-oxononanoate aminotransferase
VSGLVIGVTGTDTGAGKSAVAAGLAAALRARGLRVDAIKPVATGVEPGAAGDDAELLARASGRQPHRCVIATFRLPRSPQAAARAEGRAVDVDALVDVLRERARGCDVLVVEGIGGLLVPLDGSATVATLLRRLDAATLVAGRASLGTINLCALTCAACRDHGLRLLGVVLSDVDGVEPEFARDNAEQIARQCGVAVFGILPHLSDAADIAALGRAFAQHVDVTSLLRNAGGKRSHRETVLKADREHVWHPFTQFEEWISEDVPVIRAGDGCWLVDEDGRGYLDGIGSLWANVHGHAHPVLDRALREQAGRVAHTTFLGQTHESGALLAQELTVHTPAGLDRVFYSEAGAAAVEVALRVTLLAQRRRGQPQRVTFLSLDDAYHGDTAGAVSVGRSDPFHRDLDPLLFESIRTPSPYVAGEGPALAALGDVVARRGETIAAFIVEPRMQGAAGMLPHSDSWLRDAVETVRRAGILVICDEVATGFGRTGDLFACDGAGVVPDVLVLGKSLSGGYLPLSAAVVGEEIFDLFRGSYAEHRTLFYGHTYTANPLACAVARASLRLFATEGTLQRARSLAATLQHSLTHITGLPHVFDVRQKGVMVGIELRDESGASFDPALRAGRAVTLAARRRGVIVRPLGDVVVLNPPLVMTDEEADLLVSAVGESIEEIAAAVPARIAG